MNNYILSGSYGDLPKLCFGVSMAKNNIDNTYEYYLKFNSTINYNEGNMPDIPGNENVTRVDTLNK